MGYTWTDTILIPGSTKIKKIHVDELRQNMDLELVKRSLPVGSWTNNPIIASSTKVRKAHVDELRKAIEDANNQTPIYCNTNTPFNVNWEETIEANITKIRDNHIYELRQYTDNLEGNCYCDCNGPCNCNCNGPCNSYCAHSTPGCCHSLGSR